jgi:hypothetical protein
MIKIDHTTLNKNPMLGYYEIGGNVFWDKASALIEGTKMGLKYKDLKWVFNDQDFSKYNWQDEPSGSIRDYYHIRARQLREKYDYLILNLSGGGDSTTVLYSFIQQGLFIDEVVVRHTTQGQKVDPDHKNLHAANEFSEFEFAAKPLLKWLANVSPKTKITIHDFSKDVLAGDQLWDENFIYWTGDYVTPGCVVRYNHATNIEDLRNFDQGKRVGLIFGTDKPRVIFQKDDVHVLFLDRPVHSATPALVNNGFTNTEVELFYWSPELPQLVIKQAHIIKRWFELPANQRLSYMLDFWWQLNPLNRTVYEATIKGVIYPDYDLKTFQANKPGSAMFQEWDYWLNDFKDSNGYKTFMRGVDHLYKNIDKDFLMIKSAVAVPGAVFDPTNWEYKPCYSKRYYIGKFKKLVQTDLF